MDDRTDNESLIRTILVPEDNYADVMNTTVLPFLERVRTVKSLSLRDGCDLNIVRYSPDEVTPKGSILIIHGFTESTEKYRELCYYFVKAGYIAIAYDQRGHGRSTREVADPHLTHVEKFQDYVDDLAEVIASELKDPALPSYLFAHSMGGAVSALYLEQHPDNIFRKAVLSSPMIAPARGGFPLWFSKAIMGTFSAFGQKRKRIFLSKPPEGREDPATSANDSLARFEFYQDMKVGYKEYSNNGPTYKWTLESLNVTKKILKKGLPERIKTPLLFFIGGNDNVVLTEKITEFAARVPGAKVRHIPDCRHEIYYGVNAVLEDYLPAVLDFFA